MGANGLVKKSRKQFLEQYALDQVSNDDSFQYLLELIQLVCDVPIAYISILDDDYQYILSQKGAQFQKTPVQQTFCQHTLYRDETLIIEDTREDHRTKNLPFVREKSINFYAGYPLIDDNNNLGALCIMDKKPKNLSQKQKKTLQILGKEVVKSFRLKRKLVGCLSLTNNLSNKNYLRVEDLEKELISVTEKLLKQNQEIEDKKEQLNFNNLLLRQKAKDLELIIDALPACISFVDTNYCYQLNNKVYEEWFGFKKEDLRGKPASMVTGEEKFKNLKKTFDRAFSGEMIQFETILKGKSLRVRYIPAKDYSGKITGCFVFAEDITQIKKYQNQLEESNQDLESFAYVASHDIKSPLRTILSFGELLKNDLENQAIDYNREFLNFIIDAAKRLENLTTDLLSYAKVHDKEDEKSGKSYLKKSLEIVEKNLQESIENSKAVINFQGDEMELGVLENDLMQLLQNIIGNGIKYQSKGNQPMINIVATKTDKHCSLSIEDNGIGIAQENIAKIFQAFTRLHNSNEYAGTGIGLATCKKIVEKYGSAFKVSSVVNEGTTFSFDLPLAEA